jgi:hypothetical protein
MSSSLGFFKSIIIYQSSLEGDMDKTNDLLDAIDRQIFNPTYYENVKLFFDYVLRDVSFKDTLKDNMILYLKKIRNINMIIDSYFFTKPILFLELDIKKFYTISSLLEDVINSTINKITIDNISINTTENDYILDLQRQYRDYIKTNFFKKYMENVLKETDNTSLGASITPFIRENIKWSIEIVYNQKKRTHFEYIYQQCHNPRMNFGPKKLVTLYFMKNVIHLPKIENNYSWTHNMVAKEYDAKSEYSIHRKENLYNIRYDINNVKENELKRIYVYGYSIINAKKVFIGFAYSTTEQFRQTSRTFLSRFSVW